jgi:CPA2 family monovalent cation:H+ antiporter-2
MEFTLLKEILIIFALSTFVNFIFTRIKLPTILGYLLTGIIAGPHLTGLIHSETSIEMLAEIGVILLLFSIGLEFSINHLIKIRKIVFFGGFMQFAVTTGMVMLLSGHYGMTYPASLFVGFLTALSSTAVVLKVLQDRSELTSNYGGTVLGILIFQDLMLVPLLLFTPLMGGDMNGLGSALLWMGLKSLLIVAVVIIGSKWVMPRVLHAIVMTRNQELFFMSILLMCFSIAFLTYQLGMSLAFGAFLAGLMISESEYSHNAFGNIIPFKDTFTSFFFVSIGMLLDLNFVFDHWGIVFSTVLMVIIIKMTVAGFTGFFLGHTFRGFILVGLALAQVGEFSFILAKIGVDQNIISRYYYQLFLAVAVVTMALTPFMIMLSRPLSNWLFTLPLPKVMIKGLFPLKQMDIPTMKNHLVLIGKDSRSKSMALMANHIKLDHVSIVFDPADVKRRQAEGEKIVYGDAVNEPVLKTAYVNTAEVVVVSVGDIVTSLSVVEHVRNMNESAFILVRAKNLSDIEDLYRVGASQVIPEEFETAIEMFERVLNKYLVPQGEIRQIVGRIRKNNYGVIRDTVKSSSSSILKELPNIDISALKVRKNSAVINKNLSEMDFRNKIGVTVVAVKRNDEILENPGASTTLKHGDIVFVLGQPDKIALTSRIFAGEITENNESSQNT